MVSLLKTLIAGCVLSLILGCGYSGTETAKNTGGIDSMNRNVLETQGSSLRDPTSNQTPPIRPAYSSDR